LPSREQALILFFSLSFGLPYRDWEYFVLDDCRGNAMEDQLDQIERVIDILASCQSVLAITGAGISADSGLPTYRGIGGLYEAQDTDEGLPIEELLSGAMMRTTPELTWKYLLQIEAACRGAQFNRGHEVIAEMESHFERFWVLTQNVDGFHRQAGSKNVIDIHGDLHDLQCTHCDFYRDRVEDYCHLDLPPRCPRCYSIVRPEVILFGEMLPQSKLAMLHRELHAGFDCVLTIGTTAVFPYIAEPIHSARQWNAPTIEINPGESEVSRVVDIKLSSRAAPALEAIWSGFLAKHVG
jgi:NAD-dependent deacetylase